MAFIRRIFLFLAVNFLVILTLSTVIHLLNLQPFLQSYGINYSSLFIFCLIWGMGGAIISLLLSKKIAKWTLGVKTISANDPIYGKLYRIVEEIAHDAKMIHMPEVGVYSAQHFNAFATGYSEKNSLVAVSDAMVRSFSDTELKGVIGHEISHILSGDMVTMTLLQGVINAFVMFLARILAFFVSGMSRSRDSRSSGSYMSYFLFTYLFEIVFMLLGSIVVAAFSRWREYRADARSAFLTGNDAMIAALTRLKQETMQPLKSQAAVEALMISGRKRLGFLSLFATHPPLTKRIERLRNI